MRCVAWMILAAMTLMSCNRGFTPEERATIEAGQGNIMHVLSVAESDEQQLLRSHSLPLSAEMVQSAEYKRLRERMLATVQDPENEGVGIAAPQVGILRCVVAVQRFDKQGEPFEFYINPEIVEYIGETQAGGEGCLSVPDIRGDVERWQTIRLRYYDEQFQQHEEVIEGFTAVIFQHELDHLKGKLFIDYLDMEHDI